MPALVVVLVFVNFPALVDGTFYGKNLQRPEDDPEYWTQAIAALDAGDHQTRILEVPGSDFASYRWGNTVDPITPGLTDRPYVARELIPYGTPGSADLLNAIDRRLQEGVADPYGLAALWRRMGVGDVVARNDIQYERYDLVHPTELARVLAQVPGLGTPKSYGPSSHFAVAQPRRRDHARRARERSRRCRRSSTIRCRTRRRSCAAKSTGHSLMLSGDGEGLVDAADIGLLDGAGVVRYSASLPSKPKLRARRDAGDGARGHRPEPVAGAALDVGARQPRLHRAGRRRRRAAHDRPRRRPPRRVPRRARERS